MYVSCGCGKKLSQTYWHKATEINSLTILESRRPKSVSCVAMRCWHSSFPPEALGENPFSASSSFWWLRTFPGLWPYHCHLWGQHLQIALPRRHIVFSSLCLPVDAPSASLLGGYMWSQLGLNQTEYCFKNLKLIILVFLGPYVRWLSQVLGLKLRISSVGRRGWYFYIYTDRKRGKKEPVSGGWHQYGKWPLEQQRAGLGRSKIDFKWYILLR